MKDNLKEVISYHVDIISRGNGRSAIQKAAYCSRSRIYSEYTGRVYDYTDRHDLVYHTIMLPDSAPDAFHDSEVLWNSVEQKEKAKNARLARDITIALPNEFVHKTHIKMVRQYVQKFFVQHGMCADVSIHDKGDGNPHAHILLTTRSLDRNGEWMGKQRRNYILDQNGNRVRDPVSRQYKLGRSIKTNNWDEPERIEEWRKGWAETCQIWFRQCGIPREITHVSYARQGIDREPTIHLGARVKALEQRGLHTDRGNKNREIIERNRLRNEREYHWRERDHTYERSR